jgi:hypothetical protein
LHQTFGLGVSPFHSFVRATPPCWITDLATAMREPFGDPRGEREAAELLQKMLAAGLSRFEPDPLAAFDRIEAKKAAR